MRSTICGLLAFAVLGWAASFASAADDLSKPTGGHCRLSAIEDMKVRNNSGDDLGKIKDAVVDMKTGSISYVALDFGGFLGIGDKLFAVPWNALTVHQNGNDRYLVLNVSKERLKDAPGFDKNHWPNMANANWTIDVDKFYGESRTSTPANTK